MKLYSLESYDDKFTLKLSLGSAFWLAFLCRAIVIMPTDMYMEKSSIDLSAFFYSSDIHLLAAIISALPALAVFIAWVRRHPSAGRVPRFIWVNGKSLLLSSATPNLLVILWSVASRKLVSNLDIVLIILSFYCLFYVFRSERLRDTFMSFPVSEEAEK